jgi:WD40 repeat protein
MATPCSMSPCPRVADGNLLVTASRDRTARVWNADSGAVVAILKGHQGPVFSAEFSRDGRFVITASGDDSARIYRRERFAPLDELRRLADERPTRPLTLEERADNNVRPDGWWNAILSAIGR